MSAEIESLRFELKAKSNELEIANEQIERLKSQVKPIDRAPLFPDREGVLLVASLILRSVGKGYTSDTVRQALVATNPKEADELEGIGMLGVVIDAMAGFTEGNLVTLADMFEGLSKVDDAKWLEIVHKVYSDLKAEQAA